MSATDVTPGADRSPKEFTSAEMTAWRGLLRVHASLIKELDAELEATHRLPLTSFDVLVQLSEAPDQRLRMCDLADRVLLSRSGVSRLVDRLEREGLIERAACANDARGSYAVLTDAGRQMLVDARPTHHEGVRRRFFSHLDEGELDQLGRIWARVLEARRQQP